MGAKKGLKADQVIEALREAKGNMSLAARKLKTTRQNIAWYIANHKSVKAFHDEAAAEVSDIAEANIVNAIYKGNLNESHYWLENKGRERGYGKAPASNPLDGLTPEQVLALSDEDLDAYIAKHTRAGNRRT